MDIKSEQEMRKQIDKYRSKGYSDTQIQEVLLKSTLDPLTLSHLIQTTPVQNVSVPTYGRTIGPKLEMISKPFYKKLLFLILAGITLLFLLSFVLFFLMQEQEKIDTPSDVEEEINIPKELETGELSESQFQEELVESSSQCGDGVCAIGEYCGLDCGCDSEDDCPHGYNCGDGLCYVLSAAEASSSIGGGSLNPSSSNVSSSELSSSSILTTCVEEDCGEYICETDTACYEDCSSLGDESCSDEYVCDSTDACSIDSDSDGVADVDDDLASGEDCTNSVACASELCENGVCVECSSDDGCSTGYLCESSSCVEEGNYVCDDSDCSPYLCADTSSCGSSCSTYRDCTTGFVCSSVGECSKDSDGDGYVDSEECAEEDCREYVCETETSCYEDCSGVGDSSCSTGYVCDSTDVCSEDGDSDGVADVDDDLALGEGCTNSVACASGFCEDDLCVECSSDDGCADDEECNSEHFICERSSVEIESYAPYADVTLCTLDSDCIGTNEVCISYVCYTAECSDGVDNDGDGFIDFGNDVDCEQSLDRVESVEGISFAYAPEEGQSFFVNVWKLFLRFLGVKT